MIEMLKVTAGVSLLIALLFGVYLLVRGQLSYGQRRFTLLAIPVLSALSVWARWWSPVERSSFRLGITRLPEVTLHNPAEGSTADFSAGEIFAAVYLAGVAVMLVVLLLRIFRILRLFRLSEYSLVEGCKVIAVPEAESFSFFRRIHLRSELNASEREIVLHHEMIHVRKKHSADVLFMEILQCILWFNPVFPFLKKELIRVHEFEVDSEMYGRYRAGYMKFLLAYALGTSSSSYTITNQFLAELTLIKRIKNMKQQTKKRWVFALALPLVAGAMSLVSWTVEKAPAVLTVAANGDPQTEVDKMAEFKGGTEALIQYMTDNLKYPEAARKAGVTGKVVVGFVISEKGKVTKVHIKRGVSAELDAEAKRVVEAMPDWIPAEKDGGKVSSEMILPVAFQL